MIYTSPVRPMPEEPCCGERDTLNTPRQEISNEGVAYNDDRGQMVIPKAIRDRMGL